MLRPPPSVLLSDNHEEWPCTLDRPSRFGSLLALRYLQGALVYLKPPDANISRNGQECYDLLNSVAEAIHSLHQLLSNVDISGVETPLYSAKFGKRQTAAAGLSSTRSVFVDAHTVLVCTAVTRFLLPTTVLRAVAGTLVPNTERREVGGLADLGSHFWLFVTSSVVIGNLDLATHTLSQALDNNSSSGQKLTIMNGAFERCLRIAFKDDKLEIFKFLVSAGVDPESKTDYNDHILYDIVCAGRVDFLSALLQSTHGLDKASHTYIGLGVHWAVLHEDINVRHAMVDLLLPSDHDLNESRGRQLVLDIAVEKKDFELAKQMLDVDGEGAIYQEPVPGGAEWMLSCTTPEIRRLFFAHIHKFVPTPPERLEELQQFECNAFLWTPTLTVFSELLPHFVHATAAQRFLYACHYSGGIQEVEKHDGVLDLNMPISQGDILHPEIPIATLTVGVEALRRALQSNLLDNVKILLDRGIQSSEENRAGIWFFYREPEQLPILRDLFSRRSSPRIVIVDSWKPDRILYDRDCRRSVNQYCFSTVDC